MRIGPSLAVFGWLAALLVAPAAARTPAAPPDPAAAGLAGKDRLEALIERVKYEQKRVRTLEADFVQRKQSEFLARPEESRGVFSFAAPESVRWEYQTPTPISLVIHGEEMLTWYHDLGRAERMRVGRYSSMIFRYLNATGSLESLLQYFTVSLHMPGPGEPWRLDLQPRFQRVAKKLKSITLWIDPVRYLPIHCRYVDPEGDFTEYEFVNLRLNPEIPLARFAFDVPSGVEIRVIDLERGAASH